MHRKLFKIVILTLTTVMFLASAGFCETEYNSAGVGSDLHVNTRPLGLHTIGHID